MEWVFECFVLVFLQSRYAGGHCQCGARAKCKVTIQSGNHNHEVLCVERSFRELQVCGLMVILGAGEGKSSIAITKLRNLKKKKVFELVWASASWMGEIHLEGLVWICSLCCFLPNINLSLQYQDLYY